MSGEIAAGDIATGMLVSRAVEPEAGETHGRHADLCLNCGTRLLGAHCHACGQSGHVHRTAGAIGHEIAHGVFHFEGKIWRTLPMLALRPGELTRRYIAGERARFVSPMAIFLFSVFLLFAIVSNLPGWNSVGTDAFRTGGMEEAGAKLAEERLDAAADVARHTRRLRQLRAQPAGAETAEAIATTQEKLTRARQAEAGIANAQRYLPGPDAEADQPAASASVKVTDDASQGWFARKYRAAKANPKLLLYKIKTSAYKYSWALIPISLPFIWLLFPFRRNVGMYDHAIFATYSLSFMSLLIVVLSLLGAAGVHSALLGWAGLLIPPLHIYKQLKGGYGLTRLGALWRTMWMLIFACVTSTLFLLMLVYLGTVD